MSNTTAKADKYAIFYALQNKIIHAEMGNLGVVQGKIGTTLTLNARSLSEREQAHGQETEQPQREYKLVACKVFEGDGQFGGDDGVDRVLADRPWVEGLAFENDDFFDWYYAANILGVIFKAQDYFPLTGAVIVEME